MVITITANDIQVSDCPLLNVLLKHYQKVELGYHMTKLDDKKILTPIPVIQYLFQKDNDLEIIPFEFEITETTHNAMM